MKKHATTERAFIFSETFLLLKGEEKEEKEEEEEEKRSRG